MYDICSFWVSYWKPYQGHLKIIASEVAKTYFLKSCYFFISSLLECAIWCHKILAQNFSHFICYILNKKCSHIQAKHSKQVCCIFQCMNFDLREWDCFPPPKKINLAHNCWTMSLFQQENFPPFSDPAIQATQTGCNTTGVWGIDPRSLYFFLDAYATQS